MASLEELLQATRFMNEGRRAFISRVYSFALNAHENRKRHSGVSCFYHSSETAKILAELGMARRTISAGLLHSILKDTTVTPEELEHEFNKEIRFLVEVATEAGNIHYSGGERHMESLRKFLVAMSRDIRVLIIKFADRLHHMRTLDEIPEESRRGIATETMEIYAPLARRLGLHKLSREMEDIAFRHLERGRYEKLAAWIKKKHRENKHPLERFRKSLLRHLAKAGLQNVETDMRLKGIYSIYQKVSVHRKELEDIHDVFAIRVQVETAEDCYRTLGLIHGTWRPLPGRIKDYIAFPKPNGYRSLHTTVFTGDGGIIEVQIRTHEMHLKAEYGPASHFAYKEGNKDLEDPQYSWFNQFFPPPPADEKSQLQLERQYHIPSWLRGVINLKSFITIQTDPASHLKSDFFQRRMFIFDRWGEVIDLPLHATPVDAAYEFDAKRASHLYGVKVNGKLVSIYTELKSGDMVEILTKESAHPTEKWHEHAKTILAKDMIRQYLDSRAADSEKKRS